MRSSIGCINAVYEASQVFGIGIGVLYRNFNNDRVLFPRYMNNITNRGFAAVCVNHHGFNSPLKIIICNILVALVLEMKRKPADKISAVTKKCLNFGLIKG